MTVTRGVTRLFCRFGWHRWRAASFTWNVGGWLPEGEDLRRLGIRISGSMLHVSTLYECGGCGMREERLCGRFEHNHGPGPLNERIHELTRTA
jgi:hypothetical protein